LTDNVLHSQSSAAAAAAAATTATTAGAVAKASTDEIQSRVQDVQNPPRPLWRRAPGLSTLHLHGPYM
jgi:hypothetical protein